MPNIKSSKKSVKTDKVQSRAAEAIFNGIEKALRKMD